MKRYVFSNHSLTIAIFFVLNSCYQFDSKVESLALLNSVIDQVVSNNLYHRCLADDRLLEEKYLAFLEDSNKELEYVKTLDSVVSIRKSQKPKCKIFYSQEIGLIFKEFGDTIGFRTSLLSVLKEDFVRNNFDDFPVNAVLDSLSKPAKLNAEQVKINYLEVVNYDQTHKNNFKADEIGVIGLSQIFFDKDVNKAIVYFELYCGHACWNGKLLFLMKKNGVWTVTKTFPVWDV